MIKQGFKGRPKEDNNEFKEEVIQIDRVTRVVKGGRRLRFRATVIVGNKKGKIGVGVGKATEVTNAIQKGIRQAKKNLFLVPIVNDTIPHDIKIKFKSARVLLMPATPGTGIIAGGAVRKVVELAGIKNILSKAFGSTNKLNNAKATFEALTKLMSRPKKDIDEKGKKQVPVQTIKTDQQVKTLNKAEIK